MSRAFRLLGWLTCVLLPLPEAAAQSWKSQINTTMCNWNQARGFQLQQTIILNGGSLWWRSGYSDGTYAIPESDGNSQGTFYSLSLAQSFDANFEDGAMFGNDEEIILYGGLTRPTQHKVLPGPRELLGYRSPRAESNHDQGSFFNSSLPDNMTRYVTDGGQVSVPSENLGFYFGGMRGQDWGEITSNDASANTTANTLMMVNLTGPGDSKEWRNLTLPNFVTSRAHAQSVWIPASKSGLLAVIGGVKNPEDTYPAGLSSSLKQQNALVDVDFLRTIPLYDIAQDRWYLQNATGDVPSSGRASFCSVLASASDGSSHNIYIYGGYDGQDSTHAPYDDVYILSLPSFVWIKARSGSSRHGRSGHQCFGVLPSQMLVVGGLYKDPSFCLGEGPIRVFNLNDLEFQSTYSPTAVDPYQVPVSVRRQIGGTAEGNATRTAPERWGDPRLQALFDAPYTKPISTWYPYTTHNTGTGPESTASQGPSPPPRKWIIPVAVGVTIPLAGAACMVAIWLAVKRRQGLHGRHCRSLGIRHGLQFFCLASKRLPATEADGVPIEPTHARSVRVVDGTSELPAQDLGSGASKRSSLAETPTDMYFRGTDTPWGSTPGQQGEKSCC